MGFGYQNGELYQLEVLFNREINPIPFWAIDVLRIKKKKIRSGSKQQEIQQMNFDTLFALNKDSLNLKTRGTIYKSTSHQPYTILITTKNEVFNFMYFYDSKYYQSEAPTKERELLLNSINGLLRILED